MKKLICVVMALALLLSLAACGAEENVASVTPSTAPAAGDPTVSDAPQTVTVTDMIGRQVEILPGSYSRVVCIGAGALRMYSYIGDVSLLAGVEDIDNESLTERPMMFDSVARPYMLAYGDVFAALPSCGVGGPMAQTAEAEKILSCNPDIVISEFEDVEKEDALQGRNTSFLFLRTAEIAILVAIRYIQVEKLLSALNEESCWKAFKNTSCVSSSASS